MFDRLSLDLTAIREVGQEMTRLAGEGAELLLRNTRPAPLTLEKLDDPSPADLEFLTLSTARRTPEGVLQESPMSPGDPFAFFQFRTNQPIMAPGIGATLTVVCGDANRSPQLADEIARLVVKLGKPLPNAAGLIWAVAGLGITALVVLTLLAAILGVLHPLLWIPVAILVFIASVTLVRWAKALFPSKARTRNVVLIDPTPRREVRLMRANHRRDARVALLGFGSALLVAVLVYFLGIK
ncbi:hypothetical protein E4P40_20450 [Blastococcus sp. CT_GayMR20]|uniref:hypothetical protein n=1 Tax=Blastococcus sp. CT_GayMR20 TaxID=2559609 RepID=UPI0010732642|nr:hypothetical protein [Blastococcus sp. CT_GayMR20]TFV72483.1 hypothetical protein E4P40_20450 [Blastococcus sp. CT_GayMR20]